MKHTGLVILALAGLLCPSSTVDAQQAGKILGLTIPESVRLRVDQVIE